MSVAGDVSHRIADAFRSDESRRDDMSALYMPSLRDSLPFWPLHPVTYVTGYQHTVPPGLLNS